MNAAKLIGILKAHTKYMIIYREPPSKTNSKMTTRKSYSTAVVLIPPEAVWHSIQELRRIYDRYFDRWMPHITLLYPFTEGEDFQQLIPRLAAASAEVKPFHLDLARFDRFHHRQNCTIFLTPEPAEPIINLHVSLVSAFPGYDYTAKYPAGFHLHLSIGKLQRRHVKRNQQRLRTEWTPIQFLVGRIAFIYRDPETGDRFVVAEPFPVSRQDES